MKKPICITGLVFCLISIIACSSNNDSIIDQSDNDKPVITAEITINPNITFQKVSGFGGASIASWGMGIDISEVDKLYGQGENGLGYNIMRIQISPNGENYWLRDVEAVKRARQHGAIILATPWTPPYSMKTDTKPEHLKEELYTEYATYLKSYADFMDKQGATVDIISIQNEPDIKVEYDNCFWTPEEHLKFIKENASQIGIPVMSAESFCFNRTYYNNILNDPIAVHNIQYIGAHIYGKGLERYELAEQKGKEVWMTEHLLNDAWTKDNDNPEPKSNTEVINETMKFAKEINDCMLANFNAYIWWYLKRYYSMMGDGKAGTKEGEILTRGYMLSHFAKYVTHKTRIATEYTGKKYSKLSLSAYSDNNEVSIMLINSAPTHVYNIQVNLPFDVHQIRTVVTTPSSSMIERKMDAPDKHPIFTILPYSVTTIIINKSL